MPEANIDELEQERFLAQLPAKLRFPGGLQPFKDACDFEFKIDPQFVPLVRIECTTLDLAYVLVDPKLVEPGYAPQFYSADLDELKLAENTRRAVLCIVNLNRGGWESATINLAGPILINLEAGLGKQVIPMNAASYSTRQKVLNSGGPA